MSIQIKGLISSQTYVLLALVVIVSIISPIMNLQTANAYGGGDGSEEAPYRIRDCEDLQNINDDLDAYYVLAQDIDCAETTSWNGGAGFDPIGAYNDPFLGELDGDYHTISNLFMNTNLGDNQSGGLFERIGQSDNQVGLVKLVGLEDVDITGTWSSGGMVGVLYGQVNNVHVTGEVNGTGEVGGLVGSHGGIWDTVIDSWSSANVTGSSDVVGGLVGYNATDSNIINSFATGNVNGGDDNTGGLVGYNGGNIENSHATGHVTGVDDYTGGFVGRNYEGTITKSFATGNVYAPTGSDIGGFAGENQGEITKSYSNNELGDHEYGVTGYCRVGGFVGNNDDDPDGLINNSYSRSSAYDDTGVGCGAGGFAGRNSATIYQTYSTGIASSEATYFGGYAGNANSNGSIQVSFWDAQLTGIADACSSVLSNFDCTGAGTVYEGNSTNMKTQLNYQDGLSEGAWDFETNWALIDGENDDYPVLQDAGATEAEWNEVEEDIEDLNGDNIPDSEQPNVGGYVSSITGKLVAIDVGEDCELTVDDMTQEENFDVQDADYDYNNGLWEFEADCGTPGFTTTITLYYYDISKDDMIVRKHNPETGSYFTLEDASISETTIDDQNVVVATYQITDGGERDVDAQENGEIVDPAGLASQVEETLADTGSSILVALSAGVLMILLGLRTIFIRRRSY